MEHLSNIGRIFYGIVIAEMGAHTIYYHDFPYMLLPPKHSWIPGFEVLTYIFGIIFILAGVCIVFKIRPRQVSLPLGGLFLFIFVVCFIPYEFIASPDFMSLLNWENAEKEVAFAGGAFVIAGCFSEKSENPFNRFLAKLTPLAPILFSIPIISFGILHLLYAKEVAPMVPSWIPGPVFWSYFAGVALIGSGISIILKIKTGIIAALLGTMILMWFIILHVPRMIDSPPAYFASEVTSALLALAYSGIAFVFAGTSLTKL